MTIKHHLTDDILMGYSAGTLPEAFNLMVAAHVSLCDDCRARLEAFDAVGGAVLDADGDCMMMSDGALAATMALIAGGAPMAVPRSARRADRDGAQPVADVARRLSHVASGAVSWPYRGHVQAVLGAADLARSLAGAQGAALALPAGRARRRPTRFDRTGQSILGPGAATPSAA